MNLIYALINNVNYKLYVGSTTAPVKRFRDHISSLKYNRHRNPHLQNAKNKYGEGFLDITVIEFVDEIDNLIPREKYWINYFECDKREFGYNSRSADESRVGFGISPEAKGKISKANTGNKYCVGRPVSPETREKLRKASMGNKNCLGRKLSDKTKDKIGKGNKGKIVPQESRDKMSKSGLGRKFTDEHKENLRKATTEHYRKKHEEEKRRRS